MSILFMITSCSFLLLLLFLMYRYAYKLNPNSNFLGWRPVINGEAQPYTFWTYALKIELQYSYEEGKQRIEAYSRSLAKYEFLAKTQGYEKRKDGTPVLY